VRKNKCTKCIVCICTLVYEDGNFLSVKEFGSLCMIKVFYLYKLEKFAFDEVESLICVGK
jgi:hypothetical protein